MPNSKKKGKGKKGKAKETPNKGPAKKAAAGGSKAYKNMKSKASKAKAKKAKEEEPSTLDKAEDKAKADSESFFIPSNETSFFHVMRNVVAL